MKKLSKKHTPLLFSIIMSLFMGFLMSCIVTFINQGFSAQYIRQCLGAFVRVWPFTFILIYLLRPVVIKIVGAITE